MNKVFKDVNGNYRLGDPKTGKGQKLYPICSWERNQHKIYNANDRAWNWVYDAVKGGDNAEIERAYAYRDLIDKAMNIIDSIVICGIVYGTWSDYKLIKEEIVAYDLRH